MTSSKPNYLLKASLPNANTLGGLGLQHINLGAGKGGNIQAITIR